MPVSDWKARANLANSAKSTGPRTDAGKARSRANALKHGLTSADGAVLLTEAEAIEQRMESWRGGYTIDTPAKEWAFEQLVVSSIRIKMCQDQQIALRDIEMRRAASVWAIDNQFEAALLGDRLARKPEIVAKELMTSKYGCEWLMAEWCVLGLALGSGPWTDEQLERALDLRGIARHAREDAIPDDPAALVENEYLYLEALVNEHLNEIDERHRLDAMNGYSARPSKDMSRLRRYEAACQKRYNAALAVLTARAVEAAQPEPVEESPPPEEPQPDAYAAHMARAKAFAEYNKAWEAASEAERPNLVPNIPGLVLPPRFQDAVPAPSTPTAPPMNRKQRKALARQARNAK